MQRLLTFLKEGIIIYVGKAKKLKNRVNSYFRGKHYGKTAKLVSEIVDFEYIVVNSEIESLILEINLIKKYGNNLFFNTKITKLSAGTVEEEKVSEYVIEYNLFNALNIKNLKVKVVNDNLVYPGGNCVGLSLKTKGVTLIGNNYIITKNGNINTLENTNLKVGDVIKSPIDGLIENLS